jgi:ATP-dependent DNA ligase
MATSRAAKSTAVFPKLELPLKIPYPPMEAKRVEQIPAGDGWQFEPKWDGFRALVFKRDDQVVMQSKAGQPLDRYFPELVEAFRSMKSKAFILDGEIVIVSGGRLSFDDLLLRLHPAASRVKKLAEESPAQFFAFDLLFEEMRGKEKLYVDEPLLTRREKIEAFFARNGESESIRLSPATRERKIADDWFEKFGPIGLDGVMAKLVDEPYHSGDRNGMVKVKHMKEADCVIGGFRYLENSKRIGVLQLGLYDDDGLLHHVGNSSAFTEKERKELSAKIEPLAGGKGFDGREMGGPSRWSRGTNTSEPIPVDPILVCEVRYDYFTQGRFRHGAKFLRWRPDKAPESCTFEQVRPAKTLGKSRSLASFRL